MDGDGGGRTKSSSLRGRFWVAAVLLLALALPAIFYTQNRVQQASRDSSLLVQEHRDLGWVLNSLKDSLQVTESAIYQYPLLQSEQAYRNVLVRLAETRLQSKQMGEHYVVRRYPQFGDFTENLDYVLDRLIEETVRLLKVSSDVQTRYPAAAVLLNELQPTGVHFMHSLDLAIAEATEQAGDSDQQQVLKLLKDLRFAWAQQIGSARLFVADRPGGFGKPEVGMKQDLSEHGRYATRVNELLAELSEYDELGKLGFQQSLSLAMMRETVQRYDEVFLRVVKIHSSPDWRADMTILREDIGPILGQSWGIIELMQEELDAHAQQNVMMTLGAAGTLSNIIWGFAAIMAVLLFSAYLVFEYVLRRPILEVSRALDAEGRGEIYQPVLRSPTQETLMLVEAFQRMQGQVNSRQLRLESILDNAAEGIITIDERGIVEIFNNAAQQLFGLDAKQAVGCSITGLVRFPEGGAYENFLALCQSPRQERGKRETTITTQRQDGTSFPMVIKVNDLEIEGRRMYIAIVDDIGERLAMMEHLREMAEHDSLTGLFNRQYFMTELSRVVENINRGSRQAFALLYIDLDNFKFINDTLGHMAGDQLLVEVTELLDQRNRKSDLLARLGGDEFAILIYDVSEEHVVQAAEAQRRLLADYVFKYDGKVMQVGCSIGVALCGHKSTQRIATKEDLLVQADIACHIAKRSGRNRIHVYEADDEQNMTIMSEDMGWARRIKDAIEQDRFVLAAQPIMDVKSGDVCRYEVLLRMNDELGNLIMPAGFLASAERFGLMRSVDRWVVKWAIDYLGRQLKHNPQLHFSINLSAESIGDAEVLDLITNELFRNDVPPTSVTFEVTETVAIANLSTAVEFLSRLRNLGCQTALDDFGVGYSSFAYLKDLPVDFVKIDGSFVRDIHRDKLQLAMVRSMNDIAHAMSKRTIAEYVDNADCARILGDMGVDFIQGYHLGGPRLLDMDILFEPKSNVIRLA
ncbi:MAG: EAL domain-containing protein [Gammaproteobacteria bacterium]|nr:EAL domain-containing protein [Gammaproteobacteria bacterium]